jgi:hypothetical protein
MDTRNQISNGIGSKRKGADGNGQLRGIRVHANVFQAYRRSDPQHQEPWLNPGGFEEKLFHQLSMSTKNPWRME